MTEQRLTDLGMPQRPFAITLDVGSSLANHTGTWRTERPVYVSNLPPCNHACPAGEDIQQWLYLAEEGGYEAAWRRILADNPFPAIMGRVCYHPCETACNRAEIDEAVGINAVERFLGDQARVEGWALPTPAPGSGKRVLVVGAGPSGLSAAWFLRLLGHDVTLRDAEDRPGGMMRYGIPAYRLPRDVVDEEIARIETLGVHFELGSRVDDLEPLLATYDAVFLAVGAHVGRRAYVPAGEAARIVDAVSLLHDVEGGTAPLLGRTVAVYGGGNTALDAARTARRLGATDAVVVYRRTRDRMPAHDSEVQEALDEGIRMKWLSTVKHADEGVLLIEKMELDETGFPQPTGEMEELAADSLVLALGQDADLALLDGLDGITTTGGVVDVDPSMMTGRIGLFAGGDMVPSDRTVTVAVGHGKTAARHIDAWLRGTTCPPVPQRSLAAFDDLTTWYYSDAPHRVRPRLEGARRAGTFDEVVQGLDPESALFEARRCLSCGNCFGCDNCFGVCPDNAVKKIGAPGPGGYEFDFDFCKGCGLCVAECPCGAITMVPEE
ncbi:NAD(P)-binding protein [Nocardioides piscis]|uniref:NAD(P)-binding protein n=1 Tax=Nocardioides piscis TaxID=2714938 RepID=A0A6G7YJ75_9ACTN|nr:NAD(P)-binding protein [Nocardioides piscis]QIK76789.1 NAD(P)-binding protein [Nocardioides piscis]